MTYKQHCPPFLSHVPHLTQTLLLKRHIPYRQHLIHQQDLRLQVSGHGKAQAHAHTTGVVLHRRVNESLHFSKGHDFVKLAVNLSPRHTQDGAVQVDILSSGQFLVKARAHFQQRTHPPVDIGVAFRWLCDAREDLKQRALTCPIAADDADDFTAFDLERDVFESPDGLVQFGRAGGLTTQQLACPTEWRYKRIGQRIAQCLVLFQLPNVVLLAEIFYTDCNVTHGILLHHICKGLFHTAEVERPANQ